MKSSLTNNALVPSEHDVFVWDKGEMFFEQDVLGRKRIGVVQGGRVTKTSYVSLRRFTQNAVKRKIYI